jgi:hypothetical protein
LHKATVGKLTSKANNDFYIPAYYQAILKIDLWYIIYNKVKEQGDFSLKTSVLPEGAIRFRDLTIGGKNQKQLEELFDSISEVRFGCWAREMFRSSGFAVLKEQQTISPVEVSPEVMGLIGFPTTEQIYARANELNLDLIPAEAVPYLAIDMKDQPLEKDLFIGMKQISLSYGNPKVFMLRRYYDLFNLVILDNYGLWLHGHGANPANRWHQQDKFVFSLRKE